MKRFSWILLFLAIHAQASTITPNMSLVTPGIGDTDYPTSITTTFSLLDAHDHSSGKGLQIPTGGLANSAVTAAKIAVAVAGDGLTGGAGTALAVNPDGSSLEINSDQVRIKDSGVSTAKIADTAVTPAKMAALGQQISASCGSSFSTSSSSYTTVTNLSVSITSTGRPVLLFIQPAGGDAFYEATGTTGKQSKVTITGTTSTQPEWIVNNLNGAILMPSPSLLFLDLPAAGAHTYTVQVKVVDASLVILQNVQLVAFQL